MKNRTLCNSDTIFLLLFSIMISIQKVYVLYMVHKLLALILIFHVSCIYISVTNFALLLILVFVVQSVGQVPINCSPPGSFFLWDFPRKNTEVGCHFLFQEIFLTQGLNLCLFISCIAGKFFTTEPSGKPGQKTAFDSVCSQRPSPWETPRSRV